jgi:hypothetical protein
MFLGSSEQSGSCGGSRHSDRKTVVFGVFGSWKALKACFGVRVSTQALVAKNERIKNRGT